eukprot:m51a1_g13340 putative rna-binding motif x-linked 2 (324) ;mRNA; f:965-2372
MNVVKEIKRINQRESRLGTALSGSWHDEYKDSAWLFVGGLPYELNEGDIVTIFSQYGEVTEVNLVRDKDTGKTKGFAFLSYADQRSTVLAVDNFNGIKVLGRVLRVDHVRQYKKPKKKGGVVDDGGPEKEEAERQRREIEERFLERQRGADGEQDRRGGRRRHGAGSGGEDSGEDVAIDAPLDDVARKLDRVERRLQRCETDAEYARASRDHLLRVQRKLLKRQDELWAAADAKAQEKLRRERAGELVDDKPVLPAPQDDSHRRRNPDGWKASAPAAPAVQPKAEKPDRDRKRSRREPSGRDERSRGSREDDARPRIKAEPQD